MSPPGERRDAVSTPRGRLAAVGASAVVAARFLPIWLATGALVIVAAAIAPNAIKSTSWAFVLPYMRTGVAVILAFVACSLMAAIAGFFLAAQVQIGSPIIGNYALESIAAAVLGGASLAGGRGSYVGTLLAALFLTLIDNVLPLFQQPTEYSEITIGVLILLALVLYKSPELVSRLRTSWGGVGRLRTPEGEAPVG